MNLKVYTVYDVKAEAFLNPLYFQTRGQAIRAFSDTARDSSSMIGKHPHDYTLFEIGEYDQLKGEVKMYDAKVPCGTGVELQNLN